LRSAGPGWLGAERIEVEVCESTNDIALVHARAGAAHGTVVIADAQTAGRGRLGRVWASPPGVNVYLSAIVRAPRPSVPVATLAPMTLAVGVGVVDAVRQAGAARAALKWPNDVVVPGGGDGDGGDGGRGGGARKLAGVLCEVAGEGCVVVGIGVNVNVRVSKARESGLPAEIAARATSVCEERGEIVERAAFVEAMLREVEPWIDRFLEGGVPAIAAAWEARMATGLVLRAGGAVGVAVGLDRDGALKLRGVDGVIRRVHAGEVEIGE